MIYIALGANLPGRAGTPLETLRDVISRLPDYGIKAMNVSGFYESPPAPPSGQNNFVNAVAAIDFNESAEKLMAVLHAIEQDYGRVRSAVNAPRTLDLDLLDWHGAVSGNAPILPHPRMAGRHFVLLPLRDIAPNWVHPQTRQIIDELIAALGRDDLRNIKKIAS